MGVFKNGVGRPSNETIKKRNIFKVICVLLVLIIIVLVGYILNDKDIIHVNKKEEKKPSTKRIVKEEKVDVNKIKIVDKNRLFYNNKEINLNIINSDEENYFEIKNVKEFDSIALFNIYFNNGTILVAMNSKGKIIAVFAGSDIQESQVFVKHDDIINLSLSFYGKHVSNQKDTDFYKINGNKITIYSNNLGDEICVICTAKENDSVISSDTYTYENGTFVKEKSKILKNAKEYREDENISDEECNNSCKHVMFENSMQ